MVQIHASAAGAALYAGLLFIVILLGLGAAALIFSDIGGED